MGAMQLSGTLVLLGLALALAAFGWTFTALGGFEIARRRTMRGKMFLWGGYAMIGAALWLAYAAG